MLVRVMRGGPRPAGPVPGVFVDRDGVLNQRIIGGYVVDPSQLIMLQGAIPALAGVTLLGVPVVIVSNQGCISRGLLGAAALESIHERLLAELAEAGVAVDGIYVCPHHPEATDRAARTCDCRKPRPGLILAAARDLGIDLSRSILIGDQETDRAAAQAAGLAADRTWIIDPAAMDREAPARLAEAVAAMIRSDR